MGKMGKTHCLTEVNEFVASGWESWKPHWISQKHNGHLMWYSI